MTQKNIFSKIIALTAIVGPLVLLFLASVYNILSPREWAIGMLVWFAAILLFAVARKLTSRKTLASTVLPSMLIDDAAHRRVLRGIWINKMSIGILLVVLPFGIANGVAHRAWFPTLVGVGMNLLLVYVFARQILRRRTRLDSSRK